MKKLRANAAVKAAAVILFSVSLVLALGCAIGGVYMGSQGYYNSRGLSFYDSALCARVTDRYANTVFQEYFYLSLQKELSAEDSFRLARLEKEFAKEHTNFLFTVTDQWGHALLSNYKEQKFGIQRTYTYYATEGIYDKTYYLNAYVKDPLTVKDDYVEAYRIFSFFYSMRYAIIVIAACSALLCLLLFLFLMHAAGHRKDHGEIVLNAIDRAPLDLYGAGVLVAALCVFFGWRDISNTLRSGSDDTGGVILACAAALILALLALAFCMSFAARVKAGRWWENTLVFRVLRFLVRALRHIWRVAGRVFGNLTLLWQTVLCFFGYLFVNAVLAALLFSSHVAQALFFGVLFNFGALFGLCFLMLQMNELKLGAEKIAAGEYNWKIDASNMFWDIKRHAGTLNNIGLGMSKAVEERLKSERMKTELITNVSHDIKTPLTSIINYVDLLKKERIENENALAYIEVLDRQSARLKKLTDDLVEASKAVTGNLAVNPVRTDLIELLNQSIAEYSERFSAGRLEAILRVPKREAVILADGRLLWRVFDNLLSNICHYSQAGTRVYFDVDVSGRTVCVTLKNISQYPLNITSDELLERFVRGDGARATEGSGLGLSIAKSLTELQGGSLNLSVDGDLFKVTLIFDGITPC